MKRTDFYIIINTESGKKPVKVCGYMFEKFGHWFTVRRRLPSENLFRKKWIISDFVSGLLMTDTDSSLKDIQSAVTETMVSRLLELYKNNTVGIYEHRPVREELQHYAEMIYQATYKRGTNNNMLDLLKDQAYELFN